MNLYVHMFITHTYMYVYKIYTRITHTHTLLNLKSKSINFLGEKKNQKKKVFVKRLLLFYRRQNHEL